MATVGDLFVNVRAKTGALTKALGKTRRRLTRFARSGQGMIAGVAAGFGAFKVGNFILGQMFAHSTEFRQAWAKIINLAGDFGKKLAAKVGPQLAAGINFLAAWLEKTGYIDDLFDGISAAIDLIGPAFKGAFKWIEWAIKRYEYLLDLIMGTSAKREKLGQGITREELQAMQANAGSGNSRVLQDIAASSRRTAQNVQVPQ